MNKKRYEKINEAVYSEKLDNGLEVYVVPKTNFNLTYATFATKFGSTNTKFIPIGETEYKNVPLGVAHFLEHKLFEMANGEDAINLFEKLGAEANAFTDHNQTAYIASTTTNTKDVINLLLDFVQSPIFKEEGIIKEQGIIMQELMMYKDKPGSRAYIGVMQNMFSTSPIREDIVGTEESILQITKDVLYDCYNTFYHPANMVIVVVGNVIPEEIIKLIDDNQKAKSFPSSQEIKKEIIVEENKVFKKHSKIKMDLMMPRVSIGVKLPKVNYERNQIMVDEIKLKMLLENNFGLSSFNYQYMLDEEMFNTGFSYNVHLNEYTGYITISANTTKPELFADYIKTTLKKLNKFNLDIDDFQQMKKAVIGSFIKSFNHLDFIAHGLVDYKFKNGNLFETLELLEKITFNDLEKFSNYFVEDAISEFVILNK